MKTRVCRLYGKNDVRVETDSVANPQPGEVLVRVGRGGICGSDLHYFLDGGFGPIRVREPIIMGHEFAGTIAAVGEQVDGLDIGDKIGINPSQPCGTCHYCLLGQPQHCLEMRFIGSAFRLPHEQGGFRDYLVVPAAQCIKASQTTSVAQLACAEPLSVCLHAAKNAGSLTGKRVLINGAGPIGALAAAVAVYKGATEIVAVDIFDKTLEVIKQVGAQTVINVANNPDGLKPYMENKGYFDVVFECSAAQSALENVLQAVRPQGTIVQVGVTGELTVPLSVLVAKEVHWVGSHRFHSEYAEAVALISSNDIDVMPIVTDTFQPEDIRQALETAADRSKSVKVQLAFDE